MVVFENFIYWNLYREPWSFMIQCGSYFQNHNYQQTRGRLSRIPPRCSMYVFCLNTSTATSCGLPDVASRSRTSLCHCNKKLDSLGLVMVADSPGVSCQQRCIWFGNRQVGSRPTRNWKPSCKSSKHLKPAKCSGRWTRQASPQPWPKPSWLVLCDMKSLIASFANSYSKGISLCGSISLVNIERRHRTRGSI